MDYKEILNRITDILGIELSSDLYAKLENGDIISAVAWRVGQPVFSVSQSGKSKLADGEYTAIIPTNDNGQSVYKLLVKDGSIAQIDLQNNVKMSEELENQVELAEPAPIEPAPADAQPSQSLEEKMMAMEQIISDLVARIGALEAEDVAEGPEMEDGMDMKKEMEMSAQKKFTGAPVENQKLDVIVKSQGGDSTMSNVWKRMSK